MSEHFVRPLPSKRHSPGCTYHAAFYERGDRGAFDRACSRCVALLEAYKSVGEVLSDHFGSVRVVTVSGAE